MTNQETSLMRTIANVRSILVTIVFSAALGAAAMATAQSNMTMPDPAAPTDQATVPPPASGRGAIMQACSADIASFCAGMVLGDGKLGPCIRAHRSSLSSGCSAALQSLRGARGRRQ
ncbi:MAG: hypothetical protein B7Y45_00525 [Sphingomonas sp. 28-66-16]|nr:MAG: hypothetical protein B7Y45_00525 [Sphingomonas sp. 28-66-16]